MPRINESWTTSELLEYWRPPSLHLDLEAVTFEDRHYPHLPQAVRELLRQSRRLLREVLQ